MGIMKSKFFQKNSRHFILRIMAGEKGVGLKLIERIFDNRSRRQWAERM